MRGVWIAKYHNQFCVAAVCSESCERQRKRNRQGQRSMGLIYQAETWGLHPIGNQELGNCFELGKLIILERIEGHEIKVRETS